MNNVTLFLLSELRKENFPAPLPVVEHLLAEGETVLLVGKPKIGKSRLA